MPWAGDNKLVNEFEYDFVGAVSARNMDATSSKEYLTYYQNMYECYKKGYERGNANFKVVEGK